MTSPTKPRILTVDDSRVMRRAMSKVLGKSYDVVEAEHGEDAWTILSNDPTIQVVFTDLSMPYLDGFGLLARLRSASDSRLNHIPVIIITGKEDDEETKQRALDNGANDFITKPFDSVQLQARAQAHVHFEATRNKLNETSDRLEQQAAVDELTGLGGHRYFLKAAEEQLAYNQRHGGQFIMLRMDIDDFNRLFLRVGKEQANYVIRGVGELLAKSVRAEDMAARIGLAKFAMIMRETRVEDATETARRLLEKVASLTFGTIEKKIKITCSIGILEPELSHFDNIKAIIKETSRYLDKAMKNGGNQVVVKSLLSQPAETQGMSIAAALHLLENEHEESLKPHINSLIQQLVPLLDFIARNLDGEAADDFSEISQQLKARL